MAYLFETQSFLKRTPPDYNKPFNPLKGEILQICPQYFQDHFYNKYQKEQRIKVLADLRAFFLSFYNIRKIMYWLFSDQLSFDYEDVKEFKKRI